MSVGAVAHACFALSTSLAYDLGDSTTSCIRRPLEWINEEFHTSSTVKLASATRGPLHAASLQDTSPRTWMRSPQHLKIPCPTCSEASRQFLPSSRMQGAATRSRRMTTLASCMSSKSGHLAHLLYSLVGAFIYLHSVPALRLSTR